MQINASDLRTELKYFYRATRFRNENTILSFSPFLFLPPDLHPMFTLHVVLSQLDPNLRHILCNIWWITKQITSINAYQNFSENQLKEERTQSTSHVRFINTKSYLNCDPVCISVPVFTLCVSPCHALLLLPSKTPNRTRSRIGEGPRLQQVSILLSRRLFQTVFFERFPPEPIVLFQIYEWLIRSMYLIQCYLYSKLLFQVTYANKASDFLKYLFLNLYTIRYPPSDIYFRCQLWWVIVSVNWTRNLLGDIPLGVFFCIISKEKSPTLSIWVLAWIKRQKQLCFRFPHSALLIQVDLRNLAGCPSFMNSTMPASPVLILSHLFDCCQLKCFSSVK